MERITFEGSFCDIAQCRELPCPYDGSCTQKQVWERLKAYEDTGLEPEAVETVKLALAAKHMVDLETLNNTPISRLVELTEADKDGRVVLLPCKVGDTVWRIKRIFETYPDKSEPYIEPDAFLLQDVFNIGKTVFLTREEADHELKRVKGW